MKKRIIVALLAVALLGAVGYKYRYTGYEFLGEWRINSYFGKALPAEKPITIDKTFFIVLERDATRRAFVDKQIARADFPQPYEIFPAVDGKKLTKEDLLKDKVFTPKALRKLRVGEFGCTLSHRTLWERVAYDPAINVALILEDDAELAPDFTTHFAALAPHIPADFDLLYLYHSPRDNALVPTASPSIYHSLYLRCAHGYLITKAGARKLLKQLFPITKPVDIAIDRLYRDQFNIWVIAGALTGLKPLPSAQDKLNIYSTMPRLVQTEVMPTNIQKSAILAK